MEREPFREYKTVRLFTVMAPTGGFHTDRKRAPLEMETAAVQHLELAIQESQAYIVSVEKKKRWIS